MVTPPTSSGRRAVFPRSGAVRCACIGLAAAIMAFYLWTAQSPQTPFSFDREGPGYYSLLADGFLSGHLSMHIEPDPELLKLKDPYDPAQQAPKLHDASLYRGKYYLYFGAAPALAWFVPWKLLTGLPCSENFTDALLCCAGFATWLLLMFRIVRRHFPSAGDGLAVPLVLLLGLGNMAAVLLRRAAFWEVPIAGAYCFNALCCWFVYRALVTTTRRAYLFLALGSLSLGFSIGSRPGGIFMAAGLGLLALWLARPAVNPKGWVSARTAGLLLAALAPVSVCILGVMAYNYLRFGSASEFGTSYQLAGHNMHTWKMLDWANVPINVYYYFLSPAQFSVYFPFFEVIGGTPFKPPADYYGVENVYGILPNLPVLLLGAVVAGLSGMRAVRDRKTLGVLAVGLGFAFLAGLPVLLRYSAAASRYMVDFVPWLLALAVIGILLGEAALAGRPAWRRLFRAGWVVLGAYTVLFNVFVSFQHNDLLHSHNPALFARLERIFDRVSPALEKVTGDAHGPIELKLRLPKDRFGKLEPLVVTGLSFRADYVYLYYTDPRHVQIGFEHTGHGGGVSQPILVDYDAVQTIRVEMGSLYPPEMHPFFAGQPPARVLELKHRLKLWINGVPYRDFNADFNESSPKDVVVGRDPIFGAFGRTFTGELLSVQRVTEAPSTSVSTSYGALRVAVKFPTDKLGRHEPLVVTGRTGRGDIFYVTYVDAKTVRFTIDHWGYSEAKSPPIEIDYDHIHLLEIDLGSMHPPPAGAIPPEGFLAPVRVTMDGAAVFSGEMRFHPSQVEDIFFGLNPIGGSTNAGNFSGQVLLKEPLPAR